MNMSKNSDIKASFSFVKVGDRGQEPFSSWSPTDDDLS